MGITTSGSYVRSVKTVRGFARIVEVNDFTANIMGLKRVRSRMPTEREESDLTTSEPDSWDWITVMDGPEVSGRGKIWFGRVEDPWEQLEPNGVKLCAEPVEHIPLPRAMTRPEIEDHLAGGYGEEIIERFTSGP